MQEQTSQQSTHMSEKAAAGRLGVSRFVLLGARQRGEIGFFKFGDRILYSESHIRDYLEKCEHKAREAA